jgi:hypothetical protein
MISSDSAAVKSSSRRLSNFAIVAPQCLRARFSSRQAFFNLPVLKMIFNVVNLSG